MKPKVEKRKKEQEAVTGLGKRARVEKVAWCIKSVVVLVSHLTIFDQLFNFYFYGVVHYSMH